jgi:hypothetical protein
MTGTNIVDIDCSADVDSSELAAEASVVKSSGTRLCSWPVD